MISGSTRLIGFVGDPIGQAQSPQKLNAIFARAEVDTVCIPLHLAQGGLEALLKGAAGLKNLDGLIATIPHKFDLAELADELEENAAFSGAANVVRRNGQSWLADLFDGVGFVRGLKKAGFEVRDRSLLLLGAGGAGSAIAGALSKATTGPVTVVDADPLRAKRLIDRLRRNAPEMRVATASVGSDPGGFDIVVNATPLGMREDDPLPVDPARLSPSTLVPEIIMKPKQTRMLVEAERRGCRIHLGHHMLDGQIPDFLRFFGYGDLAVDEEG